MALLKAILSHLRVATRWLIRRAQRVVMTVSLFLVYFLGIGASAVLARLFRSPTIRWDPPGQDSYWHRATGYEPDRERARWQT
jgi:hypothetical protein